MPYPPAPWKAKGFAVQTLRLIDVDRARRFVPSELDVVSVLPGKTVGAVYVADYGPGSALEYSELIVASALTRRGRTLRFWISHIYVDSQDSMAGGREIWGLPKEMAEFAWDQDRQEVEVRRDGRLLCGLRSGKPRWLLPMPIFLPTFSTLGPDLLSFVATVRGRVGIAGGHLTVPTDSPFADLDLGAKGWTLSTRNMAFVAGAPRVVTQLSPPRARE